MSRVFAPRRPDTAPVLFGALEYELPGRSCAQTMRYHTHHRAHLAAPGRFKEPVPLPDEETAERVHMNHHIAYLLDSALPLTIEPCTSSVLTSIQQSNAQLIVRKLVRDPSFLRTLFGKKTTCTKILFWIEQFIDLFRRQTTANMLLLG